MTKTLAVLDYGTSNLYNISKALRAVGATPVITRWQDEVERADGIVLPGVGAFGEAMHQLRIERLVEPLRRLAQAGHPILGICLGMQLLFSTSEENGLTEGLGLIPGPVVRLPRADRDGKTIKIPQMGWNCLLPPDHLTGNHPWARTILDGLPERPHMYFLHSFVSVPEVATDIAAVSAYEGFELVSVIQRSAIVGCQFHPERSGPLGYAVLRRFVETL
jgi:glutamine amidotransferase